MQCVIYARVSTSEQADEKCSIPTQIAKCKSFAKEKGYSVMSVFKDEGRSGSDAKRPGLLDMIAFCEKHKIERILVLDTDRFARDEDLHFCLKAILRKNDTKLESVNQPMLDDSVEGKFLDSILAAVNAFYPKITGRKTSLSMSEKIALGHWAGPAPLGYKNGRNETIESGFEKKIIIKDELKAPFMTKMFKLFSTGAYTTETLSQKLYDEGLRSQNDKAVRKAELSRRLRNVFYTGNMLYKGVVVPGKHEPLIDMATFEKCQWILDEHNAYADRKRKHKFVLSGCIVCDICGKTFTAEKQGSTAYYHCPGGTNSHSNRHQNIRTQELEKKVEQLFKAITLSDRIIEQIRERAKFKLGDIHNDIDERRRLLHLKKEQLEEQQRTLETRYLDKKVSDDTYSRQSLRIEQEIKENHIAITKLIDHREDNIKVFQRLIVLSNGLFNMYKKADPDQRKFYVNLFWDEISVKNKQIKKAIPTKMFQVLLNNKSIKFDETKLTGYFRKSLNWLPGPDSNGQPYP